MAQVPSSDFTDIPRADGDTSFAMALMLCHNQFAVTVPTDTTLRSYATSSPITFPSGMAGGHGTQGGSEARHFRDRWPAELLGDRQPGERRELHIL